ncbi:hypothetical protein BJ138DRAFT_999222, partial [Hygrophoropsis aurantiaca]
SLCFPTTKQHLFPKLRRLNWDGDRSSVTPFLCQLATAPTLNQLTLTSDHPWDIVALAIISSLPMACPSLETITFSRKSINENVIPIVSRAICGWDGLKEVTSSGLDLEAIRHLARLPSLNALSFHLPSIATNQLLQLPGHESAFQNLRSIILDTTDMSTAIVFIKQLHISLEEFKFTFPVRSSTCGLRDLFKALSDHCDGSSLKTVWIEEYFDNDSDHGHMPIMDVDIDVIEHLFRFHNLTVLHVDTLGTYHFDDAAVTQMAVAWPKLQILSIGESRCWQQPSYITLQGLATFLKLCPNISGLTIALDTTNVGGVTLDRPGDGVVGKNLESLDVLDSKLNQFAIMSIAVFLSDIGPHVQDINAFGNPYLLRNTIHASTYRDRWESVFLNFLTILKVWNQERRWWREHMYDSVELEDEDSENYY